MNTKKAKRPSILRGSGRPLSSLSKAKGEQEKVPSSGVIQMTAIERLRQEKKR